VLARKSSRKLFPCDLVGWYDSARMGHGRRILIVDDDADGLEAMRMLLELWGHEVDVAQNGERGIELALSRRPEVVLLDIAMPGMDGYEVAERIRAAPGGHEPFLVALTGWGRVEDHRRARLAGFDTYVLKPAEPAHLQALLAAAPANGPDPVAVARKP
jgi:CheY-like chemotaxis protein